MGWLGGARDPARPSADFARLTRVRTILLARRSLVLACPQQMAACTGGSPTPRAGNRRGRRDRHDSRTTSGRRDRRDRRGRRGRRDRRARRVHSDCRHRRGARAAAAPARLLRLAPTSRFSLDPPLRPASYVSFVRPASCVSPRTSRSCVPLPSSRLFRLAPFASTSVLRRDHVVASQNQNFLTGQRATAAGQPKPRRERRQGHSLAAAWQPVDNKSSGCHHCVPA